MQTIKPSKMPFSQLKCTISFAFPAALILFGLIQLEKDFHSLFQISLFVFGWVAWTFIEYIAHRFWMHGKGNWLYDMASGKHRHHHEHPDERKVTPVHRSLLFIFFIFSLYISFILDNYFTLFAGFYSGFAGFCFLHYVLHKKWSQHIFKELIRYHIYHHCKYPDRCHGVTVTWWDKVFNTKPPREAYISDLILLFYFEGHSHHSPNENPHKRF
jgi:4-hydroxysphinganine ceramide fatty acyl 2-hydroxylase